MSIGPYRNRLVARCNITTVLRIVIDSRMLIFIRILPISLWCTPLVLHDYKHGMTRFYERNVYRFRTCSLRHVSCRGGLCLIIYFPGRSASKCLRFWKRRLQRGTSLLSIFHCFLNAIFKNSLTSASFHHFCWQAQLPDCY